MTTLSALDARFACICGGTSKQHPTARGCEHCKECEYYRPARCVCHLTRDDGKTPRCYAEAHDGDTRSNHCGDSVGIRAGATPVSPVDDALYAAWYARQLAERPEGHAAHRKRSVQWLMHPAHCPECGTKKIRWMAAQSEASHVGRNGRRLAKQYGVK